MLIFGYSTVILVIIDQAMTIFQQLPIYDNWHTLKCWAVQHVHAYCNQYIIDALTIYKGQHCNKIIVFIFTLKKTTLKLDVTIIFHKIQKTHIMCRQTNT